MAMQSTVDPLPRPHEPGPIFLDLQKNVIESMFEENICKAAKLGR